jgi:hypothetical protein
VFSIGIDAGICVLLALDLLLTWIRIPFPLLRQTAWLLTAATIAFNGAAAWPDPLGVGMHAKFRPGGALLGAGSGQLPGRECCGDPLQLSAGTDRLLHG